jgi:hypothetical protein
VIRLSDHFIDSEPEMWFELSSGRKRPEAGLHYGSLLVGQPSGCERPSEYFSRSKINTITNRDAFLGMYILEVWANQQTIVRLFSLGSRWMALKRSSSSTMATCLEVLNGISRPGGAFTLKVPFTRIFGMTTSFFLGFPLSNCSP